MSRLLTIPREIRDMIVYDFFTSPTGYLSFQRVPLSPPPTLRLLATSPSAPSLDATVQSFDYDTPFALLCTCKQLYFECELLLWHLNNMLTCSWPLVKEISTLLLVQQFRIEHVTLQVDLFSVEVWNVAAICSLEKWAQEGSLRSLNIRLVNSDELGLPGVKWWLENGQGAVREHLQMFERLDENGTFGGVKKSVSLDTNVERGVKEALEAVGGFDLVMGGLKGTLGGELWVDGALWDNEVVLSDVYRILGGSV